MVSAARDGCEHEHCERYANCGAATRGIAGNRLHFRIVSERSFCPNCEAPIAWYDNIPIISWLVLGAKCRHCKEPIAVRYPIVEALGGLSFLAVTLGALFGAYSPWILPELYVFAAVSIVIAYIDLDHHLILNVVLLPTLIATLALLALASLGTNEWNRLGRAVICAIVLGAFYLLLSIIWKGGMGDGDIKLAFILGLITGWLGWSAKKSICMEAYRSDRPCCSAYGLAYSSGLRSPHCTCK